jgi:hypothetical protein
MKWRSVRGDGVITGSRSRSGDYVIYWPFGRIDGYHLHHQPGSKDVRLGTFGTLIEAKRAAEEHHGKSRSADLRRRSRRSRRSSRRSRR